MRSPSSRPVRSVCSHTSVACCRSMLMFLRFMVSVAESTTATSCAPAALARSSPLRFGTSTDRRTCGSAACTRGRSSPASAICGTALGETKLVTSMLPKPAAPSMRASRNLSAVVTCSGWFCSPSRNATSVMWIRSIVMRSPRCCATLPTCRCCSPPRRREPGRCAPPVSAVTSAHCSRHPRASPDCRAYALSRRCAASLR